MPPNTTDIPDTSVQLMKFSTFRLFFLISLIALYLVVWRPGRALITENIVVPLIERIVDNNSETLYVSAQQKSVTFTVYILDKTVSSEVSQPEQWQERVFSFPWGFYLFFPLLFFCFVRDYSSFVQLHLFFQLGAGVICILAFILSLNLHDSLFHLYRMLTYYVVPGFAFIIVFGALFQNKFEIRRH
ncbi:MAG: hypothetical protein LAT84_04680 [Balneolia bacterium]|nr:hypothetical protein [Balneolia bacterium]